MKKTACVIGLMIALLMLSSCGGLKNRNSINAKDSLSGEKISIRINVKKADVSGYHTDFAISKDINELAEMIKKDSSLSTAVYQNKFILITTTSNVFLIEQVEKYDEDKENENRYMFFHLLGILECIQVGMYLIICLKT